MTQNDDPAEFILPGLLYGGDYNPDQWAEEVWLEDVRLMQAAGVNCVSLAIFSWAKLEPQPGQYDFGWLDRVIDLLHAHGIRIFLATATASPPPWFSRQYPESLPVDGNGLRYKQGSRQHYCPNSESYREGAARLAGRMAQRYGSHPAVLMWHVNNEYACHVYECYCDRCRDTFRGWLQARYTTLDALNDAWGTDFWSQRYGQWAEIALPNRTLTFVNPSQMLDYRRFMNASILALFRGEIEAIRGAGAVQPLFTNMVYGIRWLDQFEWARYADYTALDSYPDPSLGEQAWQTVAFAYDVMRSAKRGKPFLLLEQATTQVNWRTINQLKPPGMMRTLSYQALARGADSVMFFQWRQSKAGAEKFHSAMVPHGGADGSRIFAEVSQLGAEIKRLSALLDTRVPAEVGLLYSFENVWALEIDSKPAHIEAQEAILPWHDALVTASLPVDIVHPDMDFSGYRVLIAPLLYQLTADQADRLRRFVQSGGTLVMSYFSGIADERDHLCQGGYPAFLREVLGLRVDEWQPLLPGQTARFQDCGGRLADALHWVDLLHLDGAELLAHYQGGFIDGRPAITRHRFGAGHAFYVGTRPEAAYLRDLLVGICVDNGIHRLLGAAPGVEASLRVGDGERYLFIINHLQTTQSVDLLGKRGIDLITQTQIGDRLLLEPYGVRLVRLQF
ncbi:MAG: beta-galactosidase [Anaerolineae bacterium]|nr:beta-galactosidase [Anaerolineae bacterium]NUQ03371.1 beta-galactosidase [Anaerolineae bacterium]